MPKLFIPLMFASAACATPQAQDIPRPPPPRSGLEFFEPTITEQTMQARCVGTTATLEWRFDGSQTIIDGLAFANQPVDQSALRELNEYADEIEGNIFISMRCGRGGLAVSLVEGDSPAASLGKKILLNVVDGEVILIRRYNFE